MNMFATQGGVVELWVTKTDTYTSTKTGEIYASVQSIAPIPEGARGNAKGFEISEYNIEPTLLDAIVFEGQPVLCKFASVVRVLSGRSRVRRNGCSGSRNSPADTPGPAPCRARRTRPRGGSDPRSRRSARCATPSRGSSARATRRAA